MSAGDLKRTAGWVSLGLLVVAAIIFLASGQPTTISEVPVEKRTEARELVVEALGNHYDAYQSEGDNRNLDLKGIEKEVLASSGLLEKTTIMKDRGFVWGIPAGVGVIGFFVFFGALWADSEFYQNILERQRIKKQHLKDVCQAERESLDRMRAFADKVHELDQIGS